MHTPSSADSEPESMQSTNKLFSVYTSVHDVSVVARLTPERETAGFQKYSFENLPVSDMWNPENFTWTGSGEPMTSASMEIVGLPATWAMKLTRTTHPTNKDLVVVAVQMTSHIGPRVTVKKAGH